MPKSDYKRPHKYWGLQDMFMVRYCPVCGSDFVIPDSKVYAYKYRVNSDTMYFCRYNCLRAFLKKHEDQKAFNYTVARQKREAAKKGNKNGMEQVQE